MVDKGNCSKEFLYQCLVRDVIQKRLKDRSVAHNFLNGWEDKHPKSTLREDVMAQWNKGNRGRKDEWYE